MPHRQKSLWYILQFGHIHFVKGNNQHIYVAWCGEPCKKNFKQNKGIVVARLWKKTFRKNWTTRLFSWAPCVKQFLLSYIKSKIVAKMQMHVPSLLVRLKEGTFKLNDRICHQNLSKYQKPEVQYHKACFSCSIAGTTVKSAICFRLNTAPWSFVKSNGFF